jgi:glutamate--cysteine ligase
VENYLLDSRLSWLSGPGNAEVLRQGLRGLEKENLRVNRKGHLSGWPHPARFGAALTHPYLTTDYSEAMLEFVTPPCPTNGETVQFLRDLHIFVMKNMEQELLWAQSMPCVMSSESEIPVADYGKSNQGVMKTVYRNGLGYRYGRKMQAISGIHFNYSLPVEFWKPYRDREQSSQELQEFISSQYMGLLRNYRRYSWLLIYLYGASPALCKSFLQGSSSILEELDSSTWYGPFSTSLRMSGIGYRNKSQASLRISANSLDDYVSGLETAVSTPNRKYEQIGVLVDGQYRQLNTNTLQIENEYYSSIRPKPRADSTSRPMSALKKSGVEYIEVRTLDLSMRDPVGVSETQLCFMEAFLIYCLLIESPPITQEEQVEIDMRDLLVAQEGRRKGLKLPRNGREVSFESWAIEILEPIRDVAAALDVGGEDYLSAVDSQILAVKESELTPSAQILAHMMETGTSFLDFTLECSNAHERYFSSLPLNLEKQELLTRLAKTSLTEQQQLEKRTKQSFGDYLQGYFGQE